MHRCLACLFAGLLATPAWADFRADYAPAKSGGDDEAPALSRIEFSGGRLRTDTGRISALFDAANGRMITLNHDRHRYLDMEKAAAAHARAEAALAKLPPDQRAQAEQGMGPRGGNEPPPNVTTTPTGKTDRVAGHACAISRIDVDGEHVQDVCLATLADAGISAADQAGLRDALARLKALAEKNAAGNVRSPLADMPLDGIPLRMTSYDEDGSVAGIIELKQLTTAPVDAADFAIPPGYSEEQLGPRAH